MSAGTSEFFCLICFLICACAGQEKITIKVGQNVILPCKVPKINISNNIAVEWIRPDLDPLHVFVYRDGHIDPDHQHPSYQNRVDLQDKDMKDGDFSLILKNVKMEDTGKYECRVFEKGKKKPVSITSMEVHALEIITAKLGQDVILPCEVPNNININDITAVEWIRRDLDPEYVLVYRDGRIDPDNQHPSYQNRVDLQDKEMKDGDFSLILMNVKMEDKGTYECRVFEEGKNDPISITSMEVYLSGEKSEGDKSGIIVGSVVGVILLLAVLASLGFLICRRLKKKNPSFAVPPDDEVSATQML